MNNTMKLLFSLFMVAVYLGMAYLLIFTELFPFPFAVRIGMGALFGLYGVFRAIRLWRSWGTRV